MKHTGIARHVLPGAREVALVAAGAALAATLGAALVAGLSWSAPWPALDAPPASPLEAPVQEQAPVQPSAPAAPAQAPTLTATPFAPDGAAPPAEPAREPLESLPILQAIPSFRPGGIPPPYKSIPPQN